MTLYEDNNSFLNALTKLYQSKRASGSVWVTVKRYIPADKKGEDKVPEHEKEPKCLIRATDGYKKKISTVVGVERKTRIN
ncbi:signal recognition particle 14 kDa subunit [Heterostelium album PN500]|uniref:Signal recognition particle 14 kDa protein n=1 Tax=Heterostelium pallidum (strain ATCC 26659 / Pp 5 / PN500) TaxID=670386 RepID=D3BHP4_HETP5|nr:signal recognition particle 14 kDa subunit [Heterostelium album PN500]EFA79221.1 signal recognition particle 14 kDa subunit [Heterostelium album PN500]|eukprot:XP_020431342.1 signal recognition particle 14 kDa subunit [Heterostelium album PN500]